MQQSKEKELRDAITILTKLKDIPDVKIHCQDFVDNLMDELQSAEYPWVSKDPRFTTIALLHYCSLNSKVPKTAVKLSPLHDSTLWKRFYQTYKVNKNKSDTDFINILLLVMITINHYASNSNQESRIQVAKGHFRSIYEDFHFEDFDTDIYNKFVSNYSNHILRWLVNDDAVPDFNKDADEFRENGPGLMINFRTPSLVAASLNDCSENPDDKVFLIKLMDILHSSHNRFACDAHGTKIRQSVLDRVRNLILSDMNYFRPVLVEVLNMPDDAITRILHSAAGGGALAAEGAHVARSPAAGGGAPAAAASMFSIPEAGASTKEPEALIEELMTLLGTGQSKEVRDEVAANIGRLISKINSAHVSKPSC